jgi:uncharacterized protein (TIGR02246 family)
MKTFFLTSALVCALVTVACSGGAPTSSTPTDADRAAVKAIISQYETAYNAADAAAVTALYAETYEAFDPEGQHIQGRAGVQEKVTTDFDQFKQAGLSPQLKITEGYEDWLDATHVLTGGTWTITGGPEGVPGSGSYVSLCQKAADGSWLIQHGLVASLVPAPPAASMPGK